MNPAKGRQKKPSNRIKVKSNTAYNVSKTINPVGASHDFSSLWCSMDRMKLMEANLLALAPNSDSKPCAKTSSGTVDDVKQGN